MASILVASHCKNATATTRFFPTAGYARPLSSSRFYAVGLNSIFSLSSPIQTSLTDELKSGKVKLVCPKLPFLYCRA